ncbi:MAG: hypothetical protein MZW92_53655 [Comamonadaceae bacterium]|nr:hypothetical protein [Comamonadaceae bacterium]
MGGAQPLAATMNGAACARRRGRPARASSAGSQTRYLDERPTRLDEALARVDALAPRAARRVSIGLLGNAADVLPELVRARRRARRASPTRPRAHDPLNGYVPNGMTLAEARRAAPRATRRATSRRAARRDGASTCGRCSTCRRAARSTVRLRQQHPRQVAFDAGVDERVRLPGLRARVHPAAVLRGQGAVPLGGAVGRPGGHPRDRRRR